MIILAYVFLYLGIFILGVGIGMILEKWALTGEISGELIFASAWAIVVILSSASVLVIK